MDDLRQRLVALSERSDDALAFERLRALRGRRARSRRVGAAVLAAIVGVAGIGLAISAFSDDHGDATSTSNGGITWHRYTDPSGWSIDVPDGWATGTIHTQPPNVVRTGAEFRSAPFPSNGGYGYWGTPHGVVAVILGTVGPEGTRDASFPLAYRDAVRVDGGRMLLFKVDGRGYALWVMFATLTPRDRAIVERMVSSISFPSWAPGDARDGTFAFALHRDRPRLWREAGVDWIDLPTGTFAHFAGPSDGTLIGPIPGFAPVPGCPSGGIRSASINPRGALLRCSDGTTAGWTADGKPFASNAKRFAYPLSVSPVIRSWDGVLLTDAGVG